MQIHILGSEASATCWNWICRCLVGVVSICNLLELDLQMPGRVRKHLQFAGIGLVDTYRGEFRMWKYLQLAGIGFADAWSGLEASATCWNWICRCLVRIGSICNLLVLELQMPGRGWKHLQFAGIGLVDTYRGEFRMWKYLQLAGIGFADAWSGLEASATCWI